MQLLRLAFAWDVRVHVLILMEHAKEPLMTTSDQGPSYLKRREVLVLSKDASWNPFNVRTSISARSHCGAFEHKRL